MFLFVSLSDSSEAFCSQAYSLIFMPQLHALWCSKIRGKMSITCGNSGNYLMKYINWSKKIPSDNNWGQSVKRRVVRKVKENNSRSPSHSPGSVSVCSVCFVNNAYLCYARLKPLYCVLQFWQGRMARERETRGEGVCVYICMCACVCLSRLY